MKLSVSLPLEDIEFLDAYARAQGYDSRSAVLHKAISLLRGTELPAHYEDAWDEWESTGEAGVWARTTGDGLTR